MKLDLISFLVLFGTVSPFPYSHDNCDVDSYYAGLPGSSLDWNREQLFTLLKETHRSVLPFTTPNFAGTDDTWGALIDLDKGSGNNTVHLVYNDSDKPALPFGVRTWGKEHLWPTTRGIGTTGLDYTDIHNLRPAATLPATVRAEKYFGMCGILVRPETCEEPAQGAAPDTCSCNRLYQPPADKRGDIARALMYMDLRYDGSDENTVDLTLTDCPFNMETDMAYKSQMLTWHAEDPPDKNEITRNQLACVHWQGNRNPFIDHATLATQIFGTPLNLPLVGERLIYPECELVPTSAPTPTANVCDSMNPGDIFFFLINSMEPDSVGLFNFLELPAGFEVFLTDNAWTGSEWLTNEGIIKLTLTANIPAGEIFGYGDGLPMGDKWVPVSGQFLLSEEGEQVFVYCESADGTPRPLSGLSYNGNFSAPNLPIEQYGETQSAIPESLNELGKVELTKMKNYVYNGPNDAPTNAELAAEVQNPSNWEGDNGSRYVLSAASSARWVPAFALALPLLSILLC